MSGLGVESQGPRGHVRGLRRSSITFEKSICLYVFDLSVSKRSALFTTNPPTVPLQLIVLWCVRLPNIYPTNCRRTNLHPIYTLLLLDDLPDLVILGTRQDDSRATVRSVPAMLSIFVLERNPVSAAQTPSVSRQRLIDCDNLNARKVTHASMCTALLRLLGRLAEEAVLIRVLTAVLVNTAAIESPKDGIRTVVLGEIFFVFGKLSLVVVQLPGRRVKLGLCVRDSF